MKMLQFELADGTTVKLSIVKVLGHFIQVATVSEMRFISETLHGDIKHGTVCGVKDTGQIFIYIAPKWVRAAKSSRVLT